MNHFHHYTILDVGAAPADIQVPRKVIIRPPTLSVINLRGTRQIEGERPVDCTSELPFEWRRSWGSVILAATLLLCVAIDRCVRPRGIAGIAVRWCPDFVRYTDECITHIELGDELAKHLIPSPTNRGALMFILGRNTRMTYGKSD